MPYSAASAIAVASSRAARTTSSQPGRITSDTTSPAAPEAARTAASAVAATVWRALSNADAALCRSHDRSAHPHDSCALARASAAAFALAARSRAAACASSRLSAACILLNCAADTICGGSAWHPLPHGWLACCHATDPADPPLAIIIKWPGGRRPHWTPDRGAQV